MAYPSKQNQIYGELIREFRKSYYPGAKLPPERDYAKQLGVARKTLRFVLDRMEQEHLIVRNTHGTFLRDERTDSHLPGSSTEPITILLPCSNFLTASDHSSIYAHQQMIQGAMRATIEYGTHVVTIPVSETNDPENINWLQLRYLHKDSLIMFNGGWFYNIYPLLATRKCRIGYLNEDIPLFTGNNKLSTISYRNNDSDDFLYPAVKHLYAAGARKLLYFGNSFAVISQTGKAGFIKAHQELNLEYRDCCFQVYNMAMSLTERLALLGKLYQTMRFDALILELNPYKEHHYKFDLYQETGIPLSVKLMITVSDLLYQPKVAEHAVVCHLPVQRNSYEMAKFLLSGGKGHAIRQSQYIFQPAQQFINETRYQ